MRKIAVVTGTRAEYGLLYPLLKEIKARHGLVLQLIVTGAHLCRKFGSTYREIEKDGYPISARVGLDITSDTEIAIATAMGKGLGGFARAYKRLRPDMLVVIGDRYEILSAVAAAVPFRIAVAHLHGGESTEGAIDEVFRHAITKMSHLHFAATLKYRDRIIQMGESPCRVFNVGSLGIENIRKSKLINRGELRAKLGLPKDRMLGIVTYHPVTMEKDTAAKHILEVLKAISDFGDIYWVFTFPNADMDGGIIIRKIEKFVKSDPGRAGIFKSLGRLKYLSLLKAASVMVGNSSSGIIEAPSLRLPVVNIGTRQQGRICGRNVINVAECARKDISSAINTAISPKFKDSLEGMKNPYEGKNTGRKIADILETVPLGRCLVRKSFHDVEFKRRA